MGRTARIALVAAAIVAGATVPSRTAVGQLIPGDAARKAIVKCQTEIPKAALAFVARKLALLDQCVDDVFKCVQGKPGSQTCLDKAGARCAKARAKILAGEARLTTRVLQRCGDVPAEDLLAADGLGYDQVAAACAEEHGTVVEDLATIAECLVRRHECLAERIVQVHAPRAGELLALAGVDLGVDPCLEILGLGGDAGDAKLGARLAKCAKTVGRASGGIAARELKSLGECLSALFACVQLQGGGAACVAKAQTKCDKAYARIDQDAVKLAPIFAKACGGLPVGLLTGEDGLGADQVLGTCVALGISGIGDVSHYKNCVIRDHQCRVDDLVRFEVPRAPELLALVGRELPRGFFCPTPTPTLTPTPTPTPTP